MNTITTFSDYSNLVATANRHNELYFEKNAPEISDEEYDKIYRALQEYEQSHPGLVLPDSPTQKVGESMAMPGCTHSKPMLSLAKAFTYEEVASWYNGLFKKSRLFAGAYDHAVAVEPKYDGLSLAITYRNGSIFSAVTRGNGTAGEDVLAQAMQIGSIPKTIPSAYWDGLGMKDIEVRGEVLMPYSAFEEYNRTAREKAANPRNLASGTLRSHDASLCSRRGLVFVAWELIVNVRLDHRSQVWNMEALRNMGFMTGIPGWDSLTCYTDSLHAAEQKIRYIESVRDMLPYPIDGVVLKVNDCTTWASFGSTQHHPLYAVAYKFPAKEEDGNVKHTELVDIEFSMVDSGKVTPVVIAKTVQLYGTNVNRFSLASHNRFKAGGPWHVGDTLTVTKGGEIIPKILRHDHDGAGREIKFPDRCPYCGSPISVEGAYAWCRGTECPRQKFTPKTEQKKNDEARMGDLFPKAAPAESTSRLAGCSIVVSGTFASPGRKKQLKAMVKQHGGNLQSDVNNKTTHLLAGEAVGPKKFENAAANGVKIISEAEFLSMTGA